MSIDSNDFRLRVVRPTLEEIRLWSREAEELLMLTAAQESGLGTWLVQKNGGPALGVYQIEPATHKDIWRYLYMHSDVRRYLPWGGLQADAVLVTDLRYSTAMARVRYLYVPEAIPDYKDVQGLARYWDKYYNANGRDDSAQAVTNYWRYV